MVQFVRVFAVVVGAGVVIACGGGGGGTGSNFLLGANFGVPSAIGSVVSSAGRTATVRVGGTDLVAQLPTGVTVNAGAPVSVIMDGGQFADRAYLLGAAYSVNLTNLGTGIGGPVPGFALVQDGTFIRTDGNLAIPPGRWRLDFVGLMRFFAQTKTAAMDVQKFSFEFDVFSNGFSTLPVELYGDLPKNGKALGSLNLSGRIPPNNGFGQAFLDMKGEGVALKTYTTTKAQGAETWTWTDTRTISTPSDGWESIGIRVNF